MTTSTQIPNRLINEKSPYLLQHAHNPVDWWPWCDEAFAKAKAEDKPIFLPIMSSLKSFIFQAFNYLISSHNIAIGDEQSLYLVLNS